MIHWIIKARKSKKAGTGFKYHGYKIIWQGEKKSWQHICIAYGIRWSDKWQIFPIWNTSNNCRRSLLFGFWKIHVELSYHRVGRFNQNRKPFRRKRFWKFYQLTT